MGMQYPALLEDGHLDDGLQLYAGVDGDGGGGPTDILDERNDEFALFEKSFVLDDGHGGIYTGKSESESD